MSSKDFEIEFQNYLKELKNNGIIPDGMAPVLTNEIKKIPPTMIIELMVSYFVF